MTVIDRLNLFIEHKGLAVSAFEKAAGLSNGYVKKVKKAPSPDKCEDILKAYPDLNPSWLLYGEGEMLREAPTAQIVQGDSNTVAGRDLTTSTPAGLVDALNKALDQNARSQEQVSKAQEQIDRLLGLLEQTQQKQ